MKVHFVTSGFRSGFHDNFIGELRKYISEYQHLRFVFVASDFSSHEKTMRYFDQIIYSFQEHSIEFQTANVVDFQRSEAEAKSLILNANVVWLSGGPTLIQMRDIQTYDLVGALKQRDGITIGMSAGSINMAKRVVLAKDTSDGIPDLMIYDGIGLIDVNIEPHLNDASDEHIVEIVEAAKIASIYGLYDESFIVDIEGKFNIFGEYRLFDTSQG